MAGFFCGINNDMTSPFTNFLSGAPAANGVKRTYKSYAHATGLYQDGNRMTRLPKLGFIYFVEFIFDNSVNMLIPRDQLEDLGFLAKKVDLPKFKIATQTVNQYNRKSNIQTKLTYEPISIEFHDDNSEITTRLWQSYVQYFYADSKYNNAGNFTQEFVGDTKYQGNNTYGYAPQPSQNKPFFYQINIYVLHQGNFSQYSIANPIVSQWDHDTVQQDQGVKMLQNKITFVYDNVAYNSGVIAQDERVSQMFRATWYDSDVNLSTGYAPPAGVKPATPVPAYPTPQPIGLSQSQLDKQNAQIPVVVPPRPIGEGTWGLSSFRPPSFGLGSVDVWYGYGGLHTAAIVNAGPVNLVLKK